LTLTLRFPLTELPGITSQELADVLGEGIDPEFFSVEGVGGPVPVTPRQQGQAAAVLLTQGAEVLNISEGLERVWTLLGDRSRDYRIAGYAADREEALAGWADEEGHVRHGRMKPY